MVVTEPGDSYLTFLNHGLWLIFMTFCIHTLCNFSNFHSVGEEYYVMNPHVSFLLLPTTSFHCVNIPPFFLFSLHSILYVERKVDVLYQSHLNWSVSFSPYPHSSMLVWRINGTKKPKGRLSIITLFVFQQKHFFKMARCMQSIAYIKFIIHSYKICVLVLDALTSDFKEWF